MLKIHVITVTPFSQNARVLWDTEQGDAVVIDPGGESGRILSFLAKEGLRCTEIWLTHAHLDHCGAVAPLKESTGAKLYGHPAEAAMRAHVVDIARMYGLGANDWPNCPEPDVLINGGETMTFAGHSFAVIFTPGHSPGHVCFYNEKEKILIAGDVIFAGSIGRTDLPGGDYNRLMKTIREEILRLPDDTAILPGHGPDTVLGVERKANPFLQGGVGA